MCSSAVTILPVFSTDFRMISSSKGLMVWMLITSQEIPSFSNSSAARRDSQTKWPVATIVTSFPSWSKIPLPI